METVTVALNVWTEAVAAFEAGFREHELAVPAFGGETVLEL